MMDLAYRDRKSGNIWVYQPHEPYPYINVSNTSLSMRLTPEEARARLDLIPMHEVVWMTPTMILPAEVDVDNLDINAAMAMAKPGKVMEIPEPTRGEELLAEHDKHRASPDYDVNAPFPVGLSVVPETDGYEWNDPAGMMRPGQAEVVPEGMIVQIKSNGQAKITKSYGDHVRVIHYGYTDRQVVEMDVPRAYSNDGKQTRITYGYYREQYTKHWFNRGNGNMVVADAVLRKVQEALGEETAMPELLQNWILARQ